MFDFFVHAEVECRCAYETERLVLQASKQMNVTNKNIGRYEGGQKGWERGKRIHALWRMDRAGG